MASGPDFGPASGGRLVGLNSCSGEVWPRGRTRRAEPSWRSRSLNSCSGEVWPRGARHAHDERRHRHRVSILVLVKYGLGVGVTLVTQRAAVLKSQFLFW